MNQPTIIPTKVRPLLYYLVCHKRESDEETPQFYNFIIESVDENEALDVGWLMVKDDDDPEFSIQNIEVHEFKMIRRK